MNPAHFESLLEEQTDRVVREALREDSEAIGDITSQATIPIEAQAEAVFLAKQDGVLAGLSVATRVFHTVDAAVVVEWVAKDGDAVTKGQRLGTVKGNARSLLVSERVALNLMQRMSGVATQTRQMVDACKPHATRILDTRKTAPCMRHLDKLAVRLGGGCNHRIGLFDMVLIKDNHVDVAGGIENALKATAKFLEEKKYTEVKVEIETRNMEEVRSVLRCKEEGIPVHRVMFDNFVKIGADGTPDVSLLAEAVKLVNGQLETEASGNVTLATVPFIASAGVDFISSGALTHSVPALDISMKITISK